MLQLNRREIDTSVFTFVRTTLSFDCVHWVIRSKKPTFIQRLSSFLAAQYQSYQVLI